MPIAQEVDEQGVGEEFLDEGEMQRIRGVLLGPARLAGAGQDLGLEVGVEAADASQPPVARQAVAGHEGPVAADDALQRAQEVCLLAAGDARVRVQQQAQQGRPRARRADDEDGGHSRGDAGQDAGWLAGRRGVRRVHTGPAGCRRLGLALF